MIPDTTIARVKELIAYQQARYPDIVIPPDNILELYIENVGQNPWRVLYQLIVEDAVLAAKDAASFSDDGVSFKLGTGLSALEQLLPMYKKLADEHDVDTTDELVYVKNPNDVLGDTMLAWGR